MSNQREPSTTRWGKAHAWWQQLPDMDLDRWGVLTTLATYADEEGLCHPSQATIARALKRSRPWVNRVIGELAQAGLIQKIARTRSGNNGTTSCEYRLVTDPSELPGNKRRVIPMTPPGHDDDTLCHAADTIQSETKQNNPARPDAREPAAGVANVKPADTGQEPVPADWAPSAATMATARALRPDEELEAHALMFSSRSRSKGYLYAKWRIDEAWLGWLAEDRVKENRQRRMAADDRGRATINSRSDPAERRFAAWAAAATVPKARAPAPPSTRAEANNPWR